MRFAVSSAVVAIGITIGTWAWGGTGGSGGSGGASSDTGNGNGASGGDDRAILDPGGSRGCACTFGGGPSPIDASAALFVAGALIVRSRGRRRR